MAYTKQTWVNNDPTKPLSATRLNKLETQYDEALSEVVAQIGDSGSAIGSELSGAIAGVFETVAEPLTGASLDEAFAALDMRKNVSIVIAQASDSTGDAANEYFELGLSATLAEVWPERPARLKRWVPGTTPVYTSWNTWQTGEIPGSEAPGTIYADDFSTNAASIISNPAITPDVGSPYTEFNTHSQYFSVAGGKLLLGNPGGTRATLRALWNARQTADFDFTGKVMVPVAASNVSCDINVASNTEAVWRVGISITGTGAATLVKFDGTTTTTLATFPASTYTGTEVAFELKLVGTTLTATLAGNSVSAPLTSGEVTTINTTTKTVVRSQITGTTWDDFLVTSVIVTPPQAANLPSVDVYNGAAAGQRASYQRANLASMYPVRPDVLVLNEGHNYNPANGYTLEGFLADIEGLVDDLNALYPGKPIPVVATSQNPQFGSGYEAAHLTKMLALRDLAARKGWGYLPTFEAFSARPDGGASQMLDELHPGIGTGRVLQAEVFKRWLRSRTKRPTA